MQLGQLPIPGRWDFEAAFKRAAILRSTDLDHDLDLDLDLDLDRE
jgi:hypothetical protein